MAILLPMPPLPLPRKSFAGRHPGNRQLERDTQHGSRFSGGSGVANPVDRPGNVFDLLLAQILKTSKLP
jgi:hypothetical protein